MYSITEMASSMIYEGCGVCFTTFLYCACQEHFGALVLYFIQCKCVIYILEEVVNCFYGVQLLAIQVGSISS